MLWCKINDQNNKRYFYQIYSLLYNNNKKPLIHTTYISIEKNSKTLINYINCDSLLVI